MSKVVLGGYTSFGIGGEAEATILRSPADVPEAIEDGGIILGRGTNVLIADEGIPHRVIINRLNTVVFDGTRVYAGSGVCLISLAAMCCERGLSGLEWACGIPGSVGGAAIMNAGAFGGDFASVASAVDVFRGGKEIRLPAAECGFGYRTSGFMPGDFVTGAVFALTRREPEKIMEVQRGYNRRRALTQPKGRSAGCVFRRVGEVSAAYYIDRAGLKGERAGGAFVSELHAGFILSDGTATAKDVMTLIKRIEERVREKFGIALEREIRIIGEL